MSKVTVSPSLSRRRFLRESIAWSAFAAMPALRSYAATPLDPKAAHALVVGDWGWSEKQAAEVSRNGSGFQAQKMVAHGMERYARSSVERVRGGQITTPGTLCPQPLRRQSRPEGHL